VYQKKYIYSGYTLPCPSFAVAKAGEGSYNPFKCPGYYNKSNGKQTLSAHNYKEC